MSYIPFRTITSQPTTKQVSPLYNPTTKVWSMTDSVAINGGNTLGATLTLGTTDAFNVIINRNGVLSGTFSTDSNSNPTFRLPYTLKISSQNTGTSEFVLQQDAGSFGTWNGTNFGSASLSGYSVQEGAMSITRIGVSTSSGAISQGVSVFVNTAPVNSVPRNGLSTPREATYTLAQANTDNAGTVGASQYSMGMDFYFNGYNSWNGVGAYGEGREQGIGIFKTTTSSGALSTSSRTVFQPWRFGYNEPTKAFGISASNRDKYQTYAYEMIPVLDTGDLYRVNYADMNMLNANISLYDQHAMNFYSLQANCNTTTFNYLTGVNAATDIITVGSTTGLVTGDKIWFSGLPTTFATGVQTDTDNRITSTDTYGILANKGTYWSGTYYAIVLTGTTMQLAMTKSDAINSISIDIISAASSSGTATLYYPKKVSIKAPATLTADYSLVLPSAQSTAGQVLTNDGSGNLSWTTASGTTYTAGTGITLTGTVFSGNLSTGVSGGQTAIGGTASGNSLTLSSTSNATKGFINLGSTTGLSFDEVNTRVGIGTAAAVNTFSLLQAAADTYGIQVSKASSTPIISTSRTTTAPTSAQTIMALQGLGFNTAAQITGAAIQFQAAQTWSVGATGTDIYFYNTKIGTTGQVKRMILTDAGLLQNWNDAATFYTALNFSQTPMANNSITVAGVTGNMAMGLFYSTTATSNTAATETTLFTYTLPLGNLSLTAHRKLKISMAFSTGGTASADKEVRIYMGSTGTNADGKIYDSSAQSLVSTSWFVDGYVVLATTTTVNPHFLTVNSAGTSASSSSTAKTIANATTTNNIITVTGIGTNAGDITSKEITIELL